MHRFEYLCFDKSEQLTCLVLELVSYQNAVGLQRFVPLQVNGVKAPPVDPEEPWSIRNYTHINRRLYNAVPLMTTRWRL